MTPKTRVIHSNRNQKLKWLVDYSGLWRGIHLNQWKRIWDLKITMRDHGLYSKTTLLGDIRIKNLIREARKLLENKELVNSNDNTKDK